MVEFLHRHGIKLILSLILAGVFVWLLQAAALELLPPRGVFVGVEAWALLGYTAVFSLVHYLRAARWILLLKPLYPVSMTQVLATSFVGFAAIVLLPMRTGEVVRAALIRKKGQISGWAATGTIGAERIIDGLVLTIMLLCGLGTATTLDPLPDRIGHLEVPVRVVPDLAYAALALFGVAFVVMAVFYVWRDWARRVTLAGVGLISPQAARWLAERIEKLTDGLRFLPDARLSIPFLLVTVAYWLINSGATWILARGSGFHDFSYAQAAVVTGVLALGILVPNAPGFFGAFQVSVYAAFAMFYPHARLESEGAVYVFWVYVLQNLITAAAAVIGSLMLKTNLRELLGSFSRTLDAEA